MRRGWGEGGQREGTKKQREGESKTSRKTATVRGRTVEIKKRTLFVIFLALFCKTQTCKQKVDEEDDERSRIADGRHSKQRRKRVKWPGRWRAGKKKRIKIPPHGTKLHLNSCSTFLSVQTGVQLPVVMSQRAVMLFRTAATVLTPDLLHLKCGKDAAEHSMSE